MRKTTAETLTTTLRRLNHSGVIAAGFALSLSVGVAGSTKASGPKWDPSQMAVTRCEQELQYRVGREAGGRSPQVAIDSRRAQVRQASHAETRVSGPARYMRDSNDRGRDLTFDCTFNSRIGSTQATYRWAGPGWGGPYPDPGYDDNRPGGGSNRPDGGYPAGGRVFFTGGIVNRNSNMCLDVEGRSNRDAANVQQWGCSGGSNQRWNVIDLGRGDYAIISQGSNKALDVAGGSNRDGANVQQYRYQSGDNQRWRLERAGNGAYRIINAASGKCLDVEGARRVDGANVQQWSCGGGTNQTWILKK